MVNTNRANDETCRLCGAAGPLRESHILSKFVFRWFRKTMRTPQPTFPMYDVVSEELTVMQDGIKRPFLCGECEQRIGNWERNFKERFFDPFNARPGEAREYRDSEETDGVKPRLAGERALPACTPA